MSGQLTFMFDILVTSVPQIRAGRVRGLAVTSAKRSPFAPDIPTMAESGVPGYSEAGSDLWFGIVAPAGLPKPIVDKLNAELIRVLRSTAMRERISGQFFDVWTSTPAEFQRVIEVRPREVGKDRAGRRAQGSTERWRRTRTSRAPARPASCAGAARQPRHQPLPGRSGLRAAPRAVPRARRSTRTLLPHLERLGALAGDSLDELAGVADRNPPQLHHRDRSGADRQWIEKHPAYAEMERIAFADYGLAAMSHRAGVLGWPRPMPPAAKYALSYLFVQAEFGLCCPVSMTDALARTLAKFGAPALVTRYLPGLTATDLDALTPGRDVHDRAGRRIRRRCDRDRRAARRRALAAVRRQVVLLERRRRRRAGARAARGRARGNAGAVALPAAAPAPRTASRTATGSSG